MTTTAPRRALLLAAAADLFAARGFHAVGIDDIGAAAGISGPGVYRHFPSKLALLETLADDTMDRMLTVAGRLGTLEDLVDEHVALVVSERTLISVWVREQRSLSDAMRRSLRTRMRAYERVWFEAVAPRRPDLDAEALALTVRSALGMLNTSSLIDSQVRPQVRQALLRGQVLAALTA